MQCPQCGASLPDQASFCSHCGISVSRVPVDRVQVTVATGSAERPSSGNDQLLAEGGNPSSEVLPIPEYIAGVVVYLTIIPAIAFLFLEPFKRNFFVRFHAFQHLYLWVAGFAFAIVAGILSALLQLIPFMRVLVFPLLGLTSLAWFFLWVLLVVKAYQHELFKLPIIGDLAERQAGV